MASLAKKRNNAVVENNKNKTSPIKKYTVFIIIKKLLVGVKLCILIHCVSFFRQMEW